MILRTCTPRMIAYSFCGNVQRVHNELLRKYQRRLLFPNQLLIQEEVLDLHIFKCKKIEKQWLKVILKLVKTILGEET